MRPPARQLASSLLALGLVSGGAAMAQQPAAAAKQTCAQGKPGASVRETVEALAAGMGATLVWSPGVDGSAAAPAAAAGSCRAVLRRVLRDFNSVLVVDDDPATAGQVTRIFVLGASSAAVKGADPSRTLAQASPPPAKPGQPKTVTTQQARMTEVASSEYRRRMERQLAWSVDGPRALDLALQRRAGAAANLPKMDGSESAGYPTLYSAEAASPAERTQHETMALTLQMAGRDIYALNSALQAQETLRPAK